MNLLVHKVGQNQALVGWELPRPSLSLSGFQVQYYQVVQPSPSQLDMPHIVMVNVSGSSTFKADLHRLQPETAYEFAVRALPYFLNKDDDYSSPLGSGDWSMMQGFETLGQRKRLKSHPLYN